MWVFIITDFTHPRAPPHKRVNAFRRFQRIDFLIRKFVSTSYILTMRIRHPAYRQRRLFTDRFRAFRLRLLSADFTELPTIYVSVCIAGRSIRAAFQGVTPSFHLSDNQFADCDSSLPFCQRLTFSVRNKSHYNTRSTPDDLWMYASARRRCLAKNTAYSLGRCRQCRWTRGWKLVQALS